MDASTTALEALLDDMNWRGADEETRRLLIDNVDVGGYVGVDADEAARIDCELITAIDTAWASASNGYFGLRAQTGVLAEAIAGGLSGNATWREFGRRVGWVEGREWIRDSDVTYSLDAPMGHLPYVPGIGTVVTTGRIYESYLTFYSRVADCLD